MSFHFYKYINLRNEPINFKTILSCDFLFAFSEVVMAWV